MPWESHDLQSWEEVKPGVSRSGGTGLGLSIVSTMVENHGWNVRVTDGADGGARFEITEIE